MTSNAGYKIVLDILDHERAKDTRWQIVNLAQIAEYNTAIFIYSTTSAKIMTIFSYKTEKKGTFGTWKL